MEPLHWKPNLFPNNSEDGVLHISRKYQTATRLAAGENRMAGSRHGPGGRNADVVTRQGMSCPSTGGPGLFPPDSVLDHGSAAVAQPFSDLGPFPFFTHPKAFCSRPSIRRGAGNRPLYNSISKLPTDPDSAARARLIAWSSAGADLGPPTFVPTLADQSLAKGRRF